MNKVGEDTRGDATDLRPDAETSPWGYGYLPYKPERPFEKGLE
jgi:hypothetical protein